MVKKILVLLLCISLVESMSGCGVRLKSSSSRDKRPVNDVSSQAQSAPSVSAETESSESQPKKDSKTEPAVTPKAESETNSKETTEQWPSIEPTLLYDQDGIKITADSVSRTYNNNLQVDFTIENTSDETRSVYTNTAMINDSLSTMFIVDVTVAAGDTRHASKDIDMEELRSFGINNVGSIKMKFKVENADYSYDTITDLLDISTSLSDQMDKDILYDKENALELYNKDGVTIYGMYVEGGTVRDPRIALYIFNQTDQDLDFDTYEMSINDTMTDAMFMGGEVYSGSCRSTYLLLEKRYAEEDGVEDFDNPREISFNLDICHLFEYTPIGETGIITMRRDV